LEVEVDVDVDFVRWRVAKGEEGLRRVRGLVVLGMVGVEVLGKGCLRFWLEWSHKTDVAMYRCCLVARWQRIYISARMR
jgi:hypothetical protein